MQSAQSITVIAVSGTASFGADNNQDDGYSQIENTGNCNADAEIPRTDFEGRAYDRTFGGRIR